MNWTGSNATETPVYTITPTQLEAGKSGTYQVATVQITQNNYPAPSAADSTTDSGQQSTTQIIDCSSGNGLALITGDPFMPQLSAQINGLNSSNLSVAWRLAVTSERTERQAKDNFNLPFSGGASGGPGVVDPQPINSDWYIPSDYPPAPQEFFGGTIIVYYTIKSSSGTALTPEENLTFKIRGLNPLDATAKSYIQSNQGSYFFAWAIAQHESRQGNTIYNEFNSSGSQAELPNFSGGYPAQDGWGIFQRDDTHNGIYVDTDQVYSWAVNTSVAINELAAKQSLAQDYFNAIQRVNPTTYQPPPDNLTNWGKSGDPATSTALTALQAATITLYNGASVTVTIQDAGSNPPTYTTYLSCWQFNPNGTSGHRWNFVANGNDYVFQIIYNEYETQHSLPHNE
jgi:hypothetical protein